MTENKWDLRFLRLAQEVAASWNEDDLAYLAGYHVET